MIRSVSACALLALAACASSPDRTTTYVGPRFDLGVDRPAARAITVDAAGRIVRVHDALPGDLGEPARVVTLPGEVALTGLGDAHLHLAWIARGAESVDLSRAASVADARRAVAAHAAAHPDAPVVVGQGWDQTRWPGAAFPTADDLAPDPHGRPIVLSRVDGHALWLDRVALARVADLLATASPPPERVLRDAQGGPTGVLVDARQAIHERLTPTPSSADLRRWLERGLSVVADAGLVEIHDMATSPAELAVLQDLQQHGALPVRVVVYLDASEASYTWLAARAPGPVALGPDLEVRGVKLFADGALGSRGAALHAPYSDEPGHLGQATPLADLVRDATRAAELGYQVAIHAIGDRGNAHALSALEAAHAAATRAGHAFRGRVEHAQVLGPDDLARFVAGGFVASMQPTHATSDMRWAEARVGPERLRGAYAWRTFLDAKVALAFGTDAPVESYDPRLTLWAAVTRQAPDGTPPGGWIPEQAVTFDEAVLAQSAGVAHAAMGEHDRGRVVPGHTLALTLFASDPRSDMRGARVVGTVRGLRVRVPAR